MVSSLDTLEARRRRMNQQGLMFDVEGARSRYDQTMERGQQIAQQQNDIGMRERMQGQQLGAQMAMQGADIQSRYGLAAQEAKARERQAAQAFGHTMAQLNAEFGFKAGESNKDRSHVKSMADFEAQLREIASSNDFKRGLEKLAIEYGMSKEQATTAFERMLEGKQVDFEHQSQRDQSQHGYGQQDMRLQSQLGEQAAQSQFGRDAQMEGVRSRYDMLGNEQKFGFDTQKQQQASDLALRNQDQYWDRYRDENRGLNEQKFTQGQQQQVQQALMARSEQFDAAMDQAMTLHDSLNRRGRDGISEVQATLAQLEAEHTAGKWDDMEFLHHKLSLLPNLQKAASMANIVPQTKKVGDKEFWIDPTTKERIEVNQPERVRPLTPQERESGLIGFGPDNSARVVYQPKESAKDQDSQLLMPYKDAYGMALSQLTVEDPITMQKTIPKSSAVHDLAMEIATGQYRDRMPVSEPPLPNSPGGPSPQGQGMLQRPEAPRPQNTMQGAAAPGQSNTWLPDVIRKPPAPLPQNQMQAFQQAGMQQQPQQATPVENAAKFVYELRAQFPDLNTMPPQKRQELEQALDFIRRFKNGAQ